MSRAPIALILGATEGIGWAYAKLAYRAGLTPILVAREKKGLDRRVAELKLAGIESLGIQCNLIDSTERAGLFDSIQKYLPRMSHVFIGGPSPSGGSFFEIDWMRAREACEVCLTYPVDVLDWLKRNKNDECEVVIVSSSSRTEKLLESRFFYSSFFRRPLDQLVFELSGHEGYSVLRIKLIYPEVVLTRLSEAYARNVLQVTDTSDVRAALAKHFDVNEVPTAEEFVGKELQISSV